MRTQLYVLSMLVITFLVACDEDEPEVILPPVAAFETEKEVYDEGEPIAFFNKSENAVSFFWTFGEDVTTTEENPVYTPVIYSSFQGQGFRAKLVAVGEDGSLDSTETFVAASKRIFYGIVIKEMSESIMEKIPFEEGKSTELYLLTGVPGDNYEWINEYQTFIPASITENFSLPFQYPHIITWPNVYMGNNLWFFHFHASVEGSEEVVSIKEIYFNPTYIEPYKEENGYYIFEVGDDDIKIDVKFSYFW